MRVLITGGAGFIGSHLAAAWSERGAEVIVLDNLRTGYRSNLDAIECTFIEGSVEDAPLVREAAADCDVIHHLAALVSVPESVENPELTESINVGGTLNVLRAAREEGACKVVFSSSSAVYGMAERPIHNENDLPAPTSPYGITKLAGEHYMDCWQALHGVPTVSLRYFNVYGPRQDPKSPYAAAIAIFSSQARSGRPLVIFDDGEQTRDFVFVRDIVAANLLAAESDQACGVYNVACDSRITVNELASRIVSLAESTSNIEYRPARPGDIRHSRGDSSRLRALGWQPETMLEDGLRITLADTS